MAGEVVTVAGRLQKSEKAAATSHDIRLYVPNGVARAQIDRVIASDGTNNTATCYVFVESGGMLYHVASLTLTTAGVWYGSNGRFWIYAGEALLFRFSSVSANDVLTAAVIGTAELA